MFLWNVFLYLLAGFITFRIWMWRSKPVKVTKWGETNWKVVGIGFDDGDWPYMPEEPNWTVKGAAIFCLMAWWLFWIVMGIYYTFRGFMWLATKIVSGVIPKEDA